MSSRSSGVLLNRIILCIVLMYLDSASLLTNAAEYDASSATVQVKQKRQAEKDVCFLPQPLQNGKFYPNARQCPSNITTDACRMVPGTPVPLNWLIYYYCDEGYTLNTTKPLSVCVKGRWIPSLPICEVGASECADQGDCPDDRTCIVGKCADSCEGLCGPNTECEVSAHRPLCTCKNGYVGNPFKGCIRGEPVSVKLLLTYPTKILMLEVTEKNISVVLDYPSNDPILYNGKQWPSVAYHYKKKYIFCTGPSQIFRHKRRFVNGAVSWDRQVVVASGVDNKAKLAVDWVHDKLYWISHTDETVEVTDLDGNNRTTLLSIPGTLGRYRNNIAIDPYAGYFFMVMNAKVYRYNLDGKDVKILDNPNRNEDQFGVFILALDIHKKRVFYSGREPGLDHYLESCDYQGENRTEIAIGGGNSEIQTIDVFQDTLYYSKVTMGKKVYSLNLLSKNATPESLYEADKAFFDLKVYHPDVQLEA